MAFCQSSVYSHANSDVCLSAQNLLLQNIADAQSECVKVVISTVICHSTTLIIDGID